MGRIGLLIF